MQLLTPTLSKWKSALMYSEHFQDLNLRLFRHFQRIWEPILTQNMTDSKCSPPLPSHLPGAAGLCWRSFGVLRSSWRPWWTPSGPCECGCHPWGWIPFHQRPRWRFQVCTPATGPGCPGRWTWSPAWGSGRSPAAESRTAVCGVCLRGWGINELWSVYRCVCVCTC